MKGYESLELCHCVPEVPFFFFFLAAGNQRRLRVHTRMICHQRRRKEETLKRKTGMSWIHMNLRKLQKWEKRSTCCWKNNAGWWPEGEEGKVPSGLPVWPLPVGAWGQDGSSTAQRFMWICAGTIKQWGTRLSNTSGCWREQLRNIDVCILLLSLWVLGWGKSTPWACAPVSEPIHGITECSELGGSIRIIKSNP